MSDLVEKMARAICEACITPRVCACKGGPFLCTDGAPHVAAKAALRALPWKSCEKDNMEYQCKITCYTMDKLRNE